MPRIFDNIDSSLLPALRNTLGQATQADFCVGYFNLRGWQKIDDLIDLLPMGEAAPCRLLVGMNVAPHEELRAARSLRPDDGGIDQQAVVRLKRAAAEQFREQLVIGAPTNADEEGLLRLARQLRERKLTVKLHLRYPLHAKLYLMRRADADNPTTAYLGSSNLTLSGLAVQGELNVDVLEHDATAKLHAWFDARWADKWCIDITDDLVRIIDESWVQPIEQPQVSPYHIYLKMAYHLSREAREGFAEFRIPSDLDGLLFEFQKKAVLIAAHHLNKRGGVMIGDVVGLGKTLMATVLARIFEDDEGISTLIICPANLKPMWEQHRLRHGLSARVISYGEVEQGLKEIRVFERFRQVIIDESHNLRNREGKRFAVIQEYIRESGSKVILLTATPYNKQYIDLASQLRLFVDPEADIGIRPEAYIRQLGSDIEFRRLHQAAPRTLAAFEHSPQIDDWRDLMRLYLVRRTRSFIMQVYATKDEANGRRYLTLPDGKRSYFPVRQPKTLTFAVDENDPDDAYGRLYSVDVVEMIQNLSLPRYGLGNYLAPNVVARPTKAEQEQLENLSRAGKRLMGFSRTNLLKRLESSGSAFLQSVERHILRNHVFLHALDNGLPLPIGSQDPGLLDPGETDADAIVGDEDGALTVDDLLTDALSGWQVRAAAVYAGYAGGYKRRFTWMRPTLFDDALRRALLADADALSGILQRAGKWDPARDTKLNELEQLLTVTHGTEKVIVFTQFADTVAYLTEQLQARGITALAGVTGAAGNPTALAQRFSPVSNQKRETIAPADELRVLIATDVLSEGQNLQDAHIVVNYDLPWAIIRLIQRVGRVDRIGQQAETIRAYTFLPAAGVEELLRLRARVLQRLRENAEVVGTDEEFFDDGAEGNPILNLYNEESGILDGDGMNEGEVDLTSEALRIWENAIEADPSLRAAIEKLPDVVYSSRAHTATADAPEGVLVYLRTPQDYDALAWIGADGEPVTESQARILATAACHPATAALPRDPRHHDLVQSGVGHLMKEASKEGGQLGRPTGARYKTYVRLKRFIEEHDGTLFVREEHRRALQEIYRYPLRQPALDTLNRQLRAGITDARLAEIVFALRADDRLCIIHTEDDAPEEPRIICSLGLWQPHQP